MEIIDLEMIPGGPKKTCHASQFDNGRTIRFNLKENGQPFALSGSETVQAIIRKPDGSETTLDIANTESTYVDLITEEDTCDLAGVNHCEMKITENGEDLGSGNFDMKVENDPYGEAGVTVGTASGPIASFETDIEDELIECKGDISYRAEGYKQATFINSRSMPQKDTEPYLFRKAGGRLQNIGGQEHDTLVGGTVAFNQFVQNNEITGTGTGNANWNATNTNFSMIINHVYLLLFSGDIPNGSLFRLRDQTILLATASKANSFLYKSENNTVNTTFIQHNIPQDAEYNYQRNIIDLTAMFCSTTIADYIYSLEQATTGAGVAFFKKLFPKDYYPYNAGELISVKTSGHITRGFNQYNKETAINGKRSALDGTINDVANFAVSDYIQVTGGTDYYLKNVVGSAGWYSAILFDKSKNPLNLSRNVYGSGSSSGKITIPENCGFIRINMYSENINDACVNISGDKDGTYEPYEENAYPLDDIELRGIPKLINNRLVFDGDEYADNGAVERRYGVVDLGSLNWVITQQGFFNASLTGLKYADGANTIPNLLCLPYIADTPAHVYTGTTDKTVSTGTGAPNLWIYDSTYTDATAFKTAMSGIYLVYEKATPSEETADPFTNPQAVSKYGTEEYIDGRTVEMPVGHSTIYGDDIQAKTVTFPERIYGGEINMTTGELTSTKNADGTDKETPDTYQLTPKNLEARSGQNNIMNDTNGDSSVKFYVRA